MTWAQASATRSTKKSTSLPVHIVRYCPMQDRVRTRILLLFEYRNSSLNVHGELGIPPYYFLKALDGVLNNHIFI